MSDPDQNQPLDASPSGGPNKLPEALKVKELPQAKISGSKIAEIAGVAGLAAIHAAIPKPEAPKDSEVATGTGEGEGCKGEESGDEESDESIEKENVDLKYGPVGEIMSEGVFCGKKHTGEIVDRYVSLYREVFRNDKGTITYFDMYGNVLARCELPDNWYVDVLGTPPKKGGKAPVVRKKMTEAEQQEWHNNHRRGTDSEHKILPEGKKDLGYPFTASSVIMGMDEKGNEWVQNPLELLGRRLENKVKSLDGKRYFKGKEMTLREVIIEMAKAYDIPRAVALGIGANESAFDKKAESKAGAKGLFQLTEAGYIEARNYANKHPELSGKVREGKLLGFEGLFHGVPEWKNRLVSAEMGCAYYRYISELRKPEFRKLEDRLRKMDPTLLVGTFDTIGAITAYNPGPGRVKECIERFLKMSDDSIKKRIGEPPYGVDAWMAVIAHSFGATILGEDGEPLKDKKGNPKTTRVGLHVWAYASKVLALGSLIMDEENYLEPLSREREGWENPKVLVAEDEGIKSTTKHSRRGLLGFFGIGTGMASAIAGAGIGTKMIKDIANEDANEERGIPRRTVLHWMQGIAASIGIGLPLRKLLGEGEPVRKTAEEVKEPVKDEGAERFVHETYNEDIMKDAETNLDTLYEDLKKRGTIGWTPDELDLIYKYKIPRQNHALNNEYEKAFGGDWIKRFRASKSYKKIMKRKLLYIEGREIQKKYIEDTLENGDLIEMDENNPTNPYFCEQVGRDSGTANNPESLYMHKEFIPLLGTLIELTNHQIDIFNKNPKDFGILDENFPIIPHINAVKISGALRSVMQTFQRLMSGQSGDTKDISSHWIGQAIDLGSFATEGSHMVSFAEPFYTDRGENTVYLGPNSKLPSQSEKLPFEKRTREILSKMLGRALFALQTPLKEKQKTEILPLWEDKQLTWHLLVNEL